MFITTSHEDARALAVALHASRMRPATRPELDAVADAYSPIHGVDLLHLPEAFGPSGGVATGDEVAALLGTHCSQPISLLARWIVTRRVVSFQWQCQTLLPLFQFNVAAGCVLASAKRVVSELAPHFDDSEIADWFATPNAWLTNRLPADVIASDEWDVLQAARAARFVARGG